MGCGIHCVARLIQKTIVLLCAWVCICMGVCGCVCKVVCLCVAVCGCVCMCVDVWVVVGSACLCVVVWACGLRVSVCGCAVVCVAGSIRLDIWDEDGIKG